MHDVTGLGQIDGADMLEASKAKLEAATARDRLMAEAAAHRYLCCELEENLIPPEEAARITDERKAAADETWLRAVYGSLMAMQAAELAGRPGS